MVLAQSIIGYIVPPRQKGKYLGIMGLAFAVPTVAGPLLGGWLTDPHDVLGLVTNWRWAFWINVPLGIIALVSALVFLPSLKSGIAKPKIDYAGMALLAGATASLVLVTTWGGTTYAWLSPQIFGLLGAMVACAIGLVIVEQRLEKSGGEPVLPERLFRDRDFVLVTVSGTLMGAALFGTIFYLPTYLQMVTGSSAAKSGLWMIPMMLGVLVMAGGMGWVMSHTGRYKWICPTGMALAAIAFGLMSTMTPATPIWQICTYIGLLGCGFGMCIQTLVMIAQNQFTVEIVGTATSTNNYFREIGASIGSAFVGSMFVSKLTTLLVARMPTGSQFGKDSITSLTPTAVASYPKPVHDILVHAYNDALTPVFLYLVPFVAVACVLLLFVKEKPLSHDIEREGHSFL